MHPDVSQVLGAASASERGPSADFVIATPSHAEAADLVSSLASEHGDTADITIVTTGRLDHSSALNLGARHGRAPIIGFLDPGTQISGPLLATVTATLQADTPTVPAVGIVGAPAPDARRLHDDYRVDQPVHPGCIFVVRRWWENHRFYPYDTPEAEAMDLIAQAEKMGVGVAPAPLPVNIPAYGPGTVIDRHRFRLAHRR